MAIQAWWPAVMVVDDETGRILEPASMEKDGSATTPKRSEGRPRRTAPRDFGDA